MGEMTKSHTFGPSTLGFITKFKGGQVQNGPYIVKAGEELMMHVEWNFGEVELGKDWSLVAWGEKGPVYVYHDKDWETDYMPVAPGVPLPIKPVRKAAKHKDFIKYAENLKGSEDGDDKDCGAPFKEVDSQNRKWQVIKNTCTSGPAY
mmetsp:Transcript_21243/g.28484  ORF Transcript_21243/g.28484 Transcript_21243/m.28484 type:complete len:148 (-) Transcript_21243:340-783(-)